MSQTRTTAEGAHIAALPPRAHHVAELLDKVTLCARLNVSPRTLENMVASGIFPPPVRVGKYVYWSEVAVSAWQRRLFAAQEAWSPH